MSDIGFAKNYTNLYEINITPDGPDKTWARVAAGINSADWNGNEKTAQDDYYDGDGLGNTEVGGGQIVGTFAGHRKYGDPAQDFIASKMLDYQGRHTDFRWTSPDGSVLEGDVTLVNIDPQGGDPTSKSDFGFEVHYNGLPTYTPGDATAFPETVTAAAVTVAVDAYVDVAPTVAPETASKAVVYGIEDDSIATVDSAGRVEGIAEGATKLNVKSAAKPTVQATVEVTVTAA